MQRIETTFAVAANYSDISNSANKKNTLAGELSGVTNTSHKVHQEILYEFRQQARARSTTGADGNTVRANQDAWIDKTTGKGILEDSLMPHDQVAWNKIPDIKNHSINVFLPGYAVGDRYSAILTMLLYPKMKITIGYSEKYPLMPDEKLYAQEAYAIITHALQTSGFSQAEIDDRLSMVEYDGSGSLNKICRSFNEPENRANFKHVSGMPSAICQPRNDLTNHLFHISATTVMLAQHWEDNNNTAHSSGEIRDAVYKLVPEETKPQLDKLVDNIIAKTGLKNQSVLLWMTNKPFNAPARDEVSARAKEAFANPHMFELIQDKLEESDTPVAYIGDGFRNEYKNRTEDRHPWQSQNTPNLCKFWQASDLLKDRVNQWYFIDQLMRKTNVKALIGVRSGALEPISLLGHNVVYLEHKTMFTPERHAPWQGRIPYNRLITQNTTGYLGNDTEVEHNQLRKDIVSENITKRHHTKSSVLDTALYRDAAQKQTRFAEIEDIIQQGVLSSAELDLLEHMVETGKPAYELLNSVDFRFPAEDLNKKPIRL